MKNSQNAYYCIRSPIASRPYYVNITTKKISWVKEPGYHLCEPNDMESNFPSYDDEENEHNDNLQLVSYISKNRIYQNIEPSLASNSNEKPILQLNSPLSPSFLCTPYFPFDLLLHDSTENVAFVLHQRMQPKDKKFKRATEDLQITTKNSKKSRFTVDPQAFLPNDKKIKRSADDLLSSTRGSANTEYPNTIIPGLSTLTKYIKKFITSDTLDDYQYPNNIINSIKKSEDLLPECIYHLISLLDTTKATTSVIQSWKLMMLVVGHFPITDRLSDDLIDFLVAAAGHDEVDDEIRFRSKICLCRLFCENQLNFTWNPEGQNNDNYIKASMSMTQLLGVSLGEILVKEEYRRFRKTDYDSGSYKQINKSLAFSYKREDGDEIPVLVPLILKRLIKTMMSLNGINDEGIFRRVGDRKFEDQCVEDINNGYWEEISTQVITLSSITKRFLRELQDPLYPEYLINNVDKDTPPLKIIQEMNQIPPQNKETLMYLFGFLQQITDNQEVNKMTSDNIGRSFGDMFNNKVQLTTQKEVGERLEKIKFITDTLINYWNTSPVYDL